MNKRILTTIIILLLVGVVVCSYPIKVKVTNGEVICENLFGKTVHCR